MSKIQNKDGKNNNAGNKASHIPVVSGCYIEITICDSEGISRHKLTYEHQKLTRADIQEGIEELIDMSWYIQQ
jgi:hypothetical protein